MADIIIQKQTKNLQTLINEIEEKEKRRLNNLENVKKNKKIFSQLLTKYNEQRENDKKKVLILSNEIETLKKNKELLEQSNNNENDNKNYIKTEIKYNRFSGFEDANDLIFQKALTTKIDKIDHKFYRANTKPIFDASSEIRKLRLLEQREKILSNLLKDTPSTNTSSTSLPPIPRTIIPHNNYCPSVSSITASEISRVNSSRSYQRNTINNNQLIKPLKTFPSKNLK